MLYLVALVGIVVGLIFLADYGFGSEKSRPDSHDVRGDQLGKQGPPHHPDMDVH